MKIGDRIKLIRKEKKITQRQLAEALGLKDAAISKYEKGIVVPNIIQIENIAKALGVTPSYLMGLESKSADPSEYSTDSKLKTNVTIIIDEIKKICLIPCYESVSARSGAGAVEHRIGYISIYIEDVYDAENMFAIKAKGDSMYPKIEDGDTIVIRKQDDYENSDIVVVLIDDEEEVVKKIYSEPNKITLVSINPEYKDKVFKNEEIERLKVLGIVKQIIKDI